MGYSQVVRQWFLVPSCAGSNPANPIVQSNTQPEKEQDFDLALFFSNFQINFHRQMDISSPKRF